MSNSPIILPVQSEEDRQKILEKSLRYRYLFRYKELQRLYHSFVIEIPDVNNLSLKELEMQYKEVINAITVYLNAQKIKFAISVFILMVVKLIKPVINLENINVNDLFGDTNKYNEIIINIAKKLSNLEKTEIN